MINKKYRETYVFYFNQLLDGDSDKTRNLNASESALLYMSREISNKGKNVVVFSDTERQGFYNGVFFEKSSNFASYIRKNIMDVFISLDSVSVFRCDIKARQKILWQHNWEERSEWAAFMDETIKEKIDTYIVLSDPQKKELIKKYKVPARKIFISRSGFNHRAFKHFRKKKKQQIVFTSRSFQGLEILLDVFPIIKKQFPAIQLFIYSELNQVFSEKNAHFFEIREKCMQHGVKILDKLPQAEFHKELHNYQLIVCLNQYARIMSASILEAQAAGVVPVVIKAGAVFDSVINGKTGLVIKDDLLSVAFQDNLKDELLALLNDADKLNEIAQKARAIAFENYSWQMIAGEWVNLFNQTQPSLSLCIIAKNEQDYIADCINSVKNIVDEIIVVDTGSTDKTKKIALSCGANVYDFAWQNDFSVARNFSLSKASSDWILVLDADEKIAKKDLFKLRQLINVPESCAYLFFQRSYLNDTGVSGWKVNNGEYSEGNGFSGFFDSPLTRLFRNNKSFSFEGEVHELVENSILRQHYTIISTDIPIHHYGKVRVNSVLEKKAGKYLEIGKKKVLNNPGDWKSHYELGAQYLELKMYDKAKVYFQNALKINPASYRTMSDLAGVLAHEKDYVEAKQLLTEAIRINPEYIASLINLGIVYELLGDVDNAINVYKKALEKDIKNANAYKNLGALYLSNNEYKKAIECFSELAKIDTSFDVTCECAHANYEIALLHMQRNELKDAKTYFNEAIRFMPSFPSAYNNLGVIAVKLGDSDTATAYFFKAIELAEVAQSNYKECAKAYSNLGFIYNNQMQFKKALLALEKGLSFDCENPDIYNHIGIAKSGLGLLAEGILFFEKALALNPDNLSANINLSRVKEVLVKEHNYSATSTEK